MPMMKRGWTMSARCLVLAALVVLGTAADAQQRQRQRPAPAAPSPQAQEPPPAPVRELLPSPLRVVPEVEARRAAFGQRTLPFGCPAVPPPLRHLNVVGYYTDAAGSIIDRTRFERLQAAMQPVHHFLREVTAMTDRWARSRPEDLAPARCALTWMETWARADAMLGRVTRPQGDIERQAALAGLALAWAKLRQAPVVTATQRGAITRWLGDIAAAIQPPYNIGSGLVTRNYAAYWAGLATAATAAVANDPMMFDWAVQQARIGIAQIDADGALPLELARRSRALHYHALAAQALIMTAELAAANNVDLYAERGGALQRLARRVADGLRDPAWFQNRAGIAQESVEGRWSGWHAAWLEPFYARFPDPALLPAVQRFRPMRNPTLGGDLTFGFAARVAPPPPAPRPPPARRPPARRPGQAPAPEPPAPD